MERLDAPEMIPYYSRKSLRVQNTPLDGLGNAFLKVIRNAQPRVATNLVFVRLHRPS